jgi:hypothetical protein
MSVRTTSGVKRYLNDLVTILHEKNYFSFEEYAHNYVDELLDDILTNLSTRQHKRAPGRYARYGEDLHYASFVKNKRTTWYAFFTKYEKNGETIYLVRYIANNHTEAQYLTPTTTQ